MSEAVFEFPLKEKVRNYLRVEQLLGQLKSSASSESPQLQTVFFEQLFELLDLIERLDLRSDMSKDLDAHEKNLVYWSQHPKIDSAALEQALKTIVTLKQKLKTERRFGSALKEDKFLNAIRQRFAIPGGACSFDLPNLYFWLQQPLAERQAEINGWLHTLSLILIEPSPQLNQFYWLSWKATKPKMEKTQCNSILTYILFTAESIFMHECFMCAS